MTRRLWLVGGTTESAQLARQLEQAQTPCTITVTTPTALGLYPPSPHLRCRVGALDPQTIDQFIHQEAIAAILDLSHPFATAISQLALDTAGRYGLPYLRYERPGLAQDQVFPSFRELLTLNRAPTDRVLLTVGYRPLELFAPWQGCCLLFARILPSPTALAAALAAGFPPERLIALRPPVGAPLERSLVQQWQITHWVTKASGAPGGEATKRQVAQELGIPLLVVARPPALVNYSTDNLNTAWEFCRQHLGWYDGQGA